MESISPRKSKRNANKKEKTEEEFHEKSPEKEAKPLNTYSRTSDTHSLEDLKRSITSKVDPALPPLLYSARDSGMASTENYGKSPQIFNSESETPYRTNPLDTFPKRPRVDLFDNANTENRHEQEMNPIDYQRYSISLREEVESLKLELTLAQNLRYTAEERSIQLSYELQTMRISEAANYRAFVDLQKQIANGNFPPPNQWNNTQMREQLDFVNEEVAELRRKLLEKTHELSKAQKEISFLRGKDVIFNQVAKPESKSKHPGSNRRTRKSVTNNNNNNNSNGAGIILRQSIPKASSPESKSSESQNPSPQEKGRVTRTRSNLTTPGKDLIKETLELLSSEEMLVRWDDFDDEYFCIWVTEPEGVSVSLVACDSLYSELDVVFTWKEGEKKERVKPPIPLLSDHCKKTQPIPATFKTKEHPQKTFSFWFNHAAAEEEEADTEQEGGEAADSDTEMVDDFRIVCSGERTDPKPAGDNWVVEKAELPDPIPISEPPTPKEMQKERVDAVLKSLTTSASKRRKPPNWDEGSTCYPCYKHHISCDRQRPCGHCVKKKVECTEKNGRKREKYKIQLMGATSIQS